MTFNAEFPIRVPESFKSHKRHSSSEKSDDHYWCGRDCILVCFFFSDQASEGPFGTVENLGKHDDFLTVDELSLRLPNDGEVISVKGICSSRPQNSGGAGTCLLRNDPVKGSAFIELKVDIRVCPDSTTLTKHVISSILNVKLGEELFVKGEIQRVEKGLKSMKKGFQILPFKIVVYSNHHAAFRKDVKVKPSYLRQLSIPWPVEYGIFPAEGSTQEAIFGGIPWKALMEFCSVLQMYR